MKKRGNIPIVLASILLTTIFASLVSSSLSVGNPAGKIDKSYSSGDVLSGWINISLENEPVTSKIESFGSSMNILDFLDANYADYTCNPTNCQKAYSAINERTSASFSLSSGNSKTLALKFTGDFSLVEDISFNLQTNAAESCSSPLKIDFLNDGKIDWQYSEVGSDFCQANYGCFNFSANTQEFITTTQPYCEKIILSPVSRFRLGAYVKKTSGTSALTLSMYDSEKDLLSTCSITAAEIDSSFKEVYCDVNVSLSNEQEGYVCIGATSGSGYTIQGETSGTNCGYYSIYSTTNNADYRIFAKSAKYKAGSAISITNQTLGPIFLGIENYIADEYSNDCSSGCVIPLKVSSFAQQGVTFSNLGFKIISSGGLTVSDKFYDVSTESAKITMPFNVLYIDKANLIVPSDVNKTEATIYLDNQEILSEDITIKRLSTIDSVYPSKIPVNFQTNFVARITKAPGDTIKSYEWDFGSGIKTTSSNTISYAYSEKGNHTLKLTIKTAFGEKTKTFNIVVASAKDAINYSIFDKEQKLDEFNENLELHPLKNSISKNLNFEEIDSKLEELKLKYSIANTESEYTSIMAELSLLKIPTSIRESLSITGELVPDFDSLNVAEIQEASINATNIEGYSPDYLKSWYFSNIEATLIEKKYSISYDDDTDEIAASFFNLGIVLKNNIPAHVLIKEIPDNIEFSESYNQEQKGSNTIMNIDSDKQLEFTISGNFNDKNIFIFPELSNLVLEVSPCNFNDKCEAEIGETQQNCRQDCHSNLLQFFFVILILSAAFIGYLLLQQWYRIKYETFLFKDRNYLFNLLNFIHNAQKQKLTDLQIKNKLKKEGWTNEQLVYAMKKYKGKETGMFDIFNLLKNLKSFKAKPNLPQVNQIKRNIYNAKK